MQLDLIHILGRNILTLVSLLLRLYFPNSFYLLDAHFPAQLSVSISLRHVVYGTICFFIFSFSLLGLLVFYYFRVHIPTTIISQRFNDIVISTPSLVSAIFFCEAATPYIIFVESNFSVDILNIAHVNYETHL
jgi:hypothetical protein